MGILSEEQKHRIRAEFYRDWQICDREMIREGKRKVVNASRQPMIFVLRQIIKNAGVLQEINYRPYRDVHQILKELELTCATCGSKITAYTELGKYEGDRQLANSPSHFPKQQNLFSTSSLTKSPFNTFSHKASRVLPRYDTQPQGLVACIDDSRQIVKTMKNIICREGYDYLGIQEPLQAITMMISSKPDLIFLDIEMPICNGLEVCQKLRQISKLKDTPVVLLTSRDGYTDRARARIVGATDFISKPLETPKIVNTVEKFLTVDTEVIEKELVTSNDRKFLYRI